MALSETTKPIACTLGGPTMAERLHRIKALTDTSLLSHELRGDQLRLVYRHDAVNEVRAIVELERDCCTFLNFVIEDVRPSIVLIISAPPDAREAAAWLFAHFLPRNGDQEPGKACGCVAERICR